ncbi:LysR family transcriptional regulator [Shewanella eurypsychrophilus]|uniref:LysR family transcriptional regulator n=1 Tax=Shewanella eurypsychrophilus TaxID=2593656 RepID=A0ABX6VB06_9GAMM|nr:MULTISPECIES: LysR family transcriptional regulator [Shewanella]QFU22402.1 LysR family transcriptional regulator [Shewanella sp. YLB-09]QPG57689.1 LysR family transcriptional regulator [Shewanella eurypsychrophilus]
MVSFIIKTRNNSIINSIFEIMLDDIALFIHIVQSRGLASAAKQLHLPAATVTRRLQKLEATIGRKLIHRSARQFALTAEGEVYYQAFYELVQSFETTQRSLSTELNLLSGKLKVLAPTNISTGLLQPMWSSFIKSYPDIQLDLNLNNANQDILAVQSDIALRIGPQKDSQLYQKGLGFIPTVLVASNAYLAQNAAPTQLGELSQHRIIGVNSISLWTLTHRISGHKVELKPSINTFVNDIKMASQWACDGIGIALLPISEVYKDLQDGNLVQVLTKWTGPRRELYAVWPSGRLLSAKAKCLRDFMLDYIEKNEVLQTQGISDICNR